MSTSPSNNQQPILDPPQPQPLLPKQADPTRTEGSHLWGHQEKQIVLFAYHCQIGQEPPQNIMVMQQPRKKLKVEAPQQALTRMMAQCQIAPSVKQSTQLFLTRVGHEERGELSAQLKEMAQRSHQEGWEQRKARREAIFRAGRTKGAMEEASEKVLAERKIRVVRLESLREGGGVRGIVQLGGSPFEYQDLLANEQQEYYTLVRRKVPYPEQYPFVSLEQDIISPILPPSPPDSPSPDDDFDSNDEDNPDYDYPDEEQEELSSRGSGRLIGRGEGYWGDSSGGEWEQGGEREWEQDEEEVYRRYLRRQRNKNKQMLEEEYMVDYDYQ